MGDTAKTSCLHVIYNSILSESEKEKNPFLLLVIGICRNSSQKEIWCREEEFLGFECSNDTQMPC